MTADWHLHPWRICSHDGGADRLADGIDVGRQILSIARAANLPVVIAGDLKEVRGMWLVPVQNALLALLREFHDIEITVLSGQHDGRADGRSGLDSLRELPNVSVIDHPCIDTSPDNECMAGYWPYQRDLTEMPAFLQEARAQKATYLFAHAYLQAAIIGPNEIRLKKGHTIDEFGLFGKDRVFQYGFFGDIHKQQKIGNHIWYAGSPYALKSDEQEINKGVFHVQTKNGKVIRVDPIPIEGPRFISADWSAVTAINTALPAYLKNDPDVWKGHFVKLLVNPDVDYGMLEGLRESCGTRDFQVIPIRKQKTERRAEVHAGLPVRELLAKYVAARPPGKELNQKTVLAAGMHLFGEGK